MRIDSYRKPPLDPETRTVRTPPAWPFTFTARALFGTARPGPPWLER
jgi:hypothetical protein